MSGSALIAFSFALVSAPVASGQEAQQAPITVGTRVRVFAPDLRTDRYVGEIRSLDRSAMVLDTAGARVRLGLETGPVLVDRFRRVTIELAQIQQIEVSGGRTVRTPIMKGAVIGALIGAVVYGLGNLPEKNPRAVDFFNGAPTGFVVGGIVGGAIGWGLGGERWLPARLPR
jgi:hypothetical protein